jgi:translation initiation factor 2 beta subunit (eIF-2beta)/eIF-5
MIKKTEKEQEIIDVYQSEIDKLRDENEILKLRISLNDSIVEFFKKNYVTGVTINKKS